MKRRATYEIRVSRLAETPGDHSVVDPEATHAFWQKVITAASWYDPEKEMLVGVYLNTKYRSIGHSLISLGSKNQTIAEPCEIFRPGIALAAYAMVLMHNHPSGDCTPSELDRRLTKRILDGSEILGMKLLDHLIIGKTTFPAYPPYFSFREAGLI
jgi:DNA repair protein RadC